MSRVKIQKGDRLVTRPVKGVMLKHCHSTGVLLALIVIILKCSEEHPPTHLDSLQDTDGTSQVI